MTRVALILAMTVWATSAFADGPIIPKFEDVTSASGLNSIYKGDWQYMVGGGVATFDCNDDGFPDVYAAGGENKAKLFVNHSKAGGALKFSEAASGAEFDRVTGAYPIDIDSDGIMDLVVLRVGKNKIMKGLGKCRFGEMNKIWNVDTEDSWHTAFSATWERGNLWPTLAFGTYIDRKFEDQPWGHCSDNFLLRPKTDQKSFGQRILLIPSYCALSMLFTDWNRSGTQSLRVSNDREYYEGGQEQLWKMPIGSAPSLYTEAEGWRFVRLWGMGIASADLNGDNYPEYFLSSMADQRMQILANGAAKPSYKEAQFAMGTTAHRPYTGGDDKPSTGWHTQFEDVNNDGLYDLFIAKGNVDRMPDFAQQDPSNLLLQNADGKFSEAGETSNMLNFDQARGASVADFNLDGKLDVLIINRRSNVRLFQNVSQSLGHWLGLHLQQQGANPDGIGSWIEVKVGEKTMRREITSGGGHASGQNTWWHFGLGEFKETEVRVIWPDGKTGDWQRLAGDSFYFLPRDKPAKMWNPLD